MTADWRHAEAEAILSDMAGRIAAAAPRGWKRATLRGYAIGPDGSGHRGLVFEPDQLNEYGADRIDVYDGMRELHTLLEAAGHLTIELEIEAGGRYRAVLSEHLDRVGNRGFRYLFDLQSGPPEPDELRTGPDSIEAGDPVEAVALLREYLRMLNEILPVVARLRLPPPLPASSRQRFMAEMDSALPRDLDALYAEADGDGDAGLFLGHTWFGLEMLAGPWQAEARSWGIRGWQAYEFRPPMLIKEFGPPLTIRRLSDHPAWIPFATDTGGNALAVDMASGPRGRPGQVILIGSDQYEGPTYVADSVTSLLRSRVRALADGCFDRVDDLHHYERRYDEACVLAVTGRAAAPVRGMRAETRELTVSHAPLVDLGPVRGAPALWQVSVDDCASIDLSPLRETPVEVLDLGMDTIDLAGIEAHPTLRKVVLHSDRPVDLRPLLSCPRLYALDLSDAVGDLSVLRGLPGLRYLKMRFAGWKELLRDKAVPAALVAADLAEEPPRSPRVYWSFEKATRMPRPTLKDALGWVQLLAGDTADIRTVSGKYVAARHR